MTSTMLPLPPFFDPANAERHAFAADPARVFAAAAEWRRAHAVAPAWADRVRVHLLLIDVQKDFCFPEGSLYVGGRSGRGAIDDNRRTAEFIYRNLAWLTNITTTLDTHFAFQIFFPSFWVGKDGAPLRAHREVSSEDIDQGEARPNPDVASWLCGGDQAWLLAQMRDYCAQLEKAGKYRLYLWPPHCLLGSPGHTLAGIIEEARLFHSFARGVQSWIEEKGSNPLTENYSVLRSEVLSRHDGVALAERNTALVERLLGSDKLVIAGQAASHCVKSTIDDLLDAIRARDPALAQKVYVLEDCMSAVTVPDDRGGFLADFTQQAEASLARYVDAGMHVVRSTDPVDTWP